MKRFFYLIFACALLIGCSKDNITHEYVIDAYVKSLKVNEYNDAGAIINTRTVYFSNDDDTQTVTSAAGATSVSIPRQKVNSFLTSYSYYVGGDEKYALPSGKKRLHLHIFTDSVSASIY